MKYIDKIQIVVSSGKGGDGMVSFHRARNRPKLGPDGGNGGNGGDVVFVGDPHLNTLSHLIYNKNYRAEHGGKGGPQNKTGSCGDPLEIKGPLGTVVYHEDTNEKIVEVLRADEITVVAKGGKRGYGNLSYTTPTRQAPIISTEGQEGTTITLRCELKVLADVGFLGFPNAGKSTLLSVISKARPKIANYPFTTLHPNLGVVDLHCPDEKYSSFVVADLPGIIEGAAEGKGLGHRFLKHLERCKVVVFVLDAFCEERTLEQSINLLSDELRNFSTALAARKKIVAINKIDLISSEKTKELLNSLQSKDLEVYPISAVTKDGISPLLRGVQNLVKIENTQS
jgi:GTP-binding protein